MKSSIEIKRIAIVMLAPALFSSTAHRLHAQAPAALTPQSMPRVGTVDPRFQAYNIEMVEVTGGRFWAPYKKQAEAQTKPQSDSSASVPAGMDPSLYRYRPPIDLYNAKLRKLAAALGPSYVRVSGTWANSTYFHDSDSPAPEKPPAGFGGVLTRKQWKGVIDFSKAADARIVTSFAISGGVRDASGVWTPVEAKKIFAFTKANGGAIAAAEMFNEPNLATMGGAPKGYDAAAYGRDFRAFDAFVKKTAPKMQVLGPSGTGDLGFGDKTESAVAGIKLIKSEDMLRDEGPGLDAFSYHYYGAVSQRCKQFGPSMLTSPDAALTEDWLNRTDTFAVFYVGLRDKYTPGKPLWLTETAQAACGGDPWASTFIDSFRYLNQLGLLARRGVQVVMHNTLASSDYGLLDEDTLTPRPNYWSALLWHKLMGATVLNPDSAAGPAAPPVYLYAHCLRNQPGGVAILAINADRNDAHEITLPEASERYTLASDNLLSTQVSLNGVDLALDSKGNLPALTGTPTPAGSITLAPTTITFLGVAKANNAACRK